MKALVTGGTGFIGSNIALRLVERGWQVRILERPGASRILLEDGPFEFVTGDVLQPETLPPAMEGVDVVIHAAGVVDYWRQGVERMYAVNVEGTRNVMRAALKRRIPRVVHTSSTAAMGIHPNEVVDETFTFNVRPERFVYGHSKYLAEQVVYEYIRQGLPAVIVNPTTVLGPRDIRKVSSGVVVEVVKHCVPPLIPPGGVNIAPICDVAHGVIEAALKGKVGERYILGGENLSFRAVFTAANELFGRGAPSVVLPRWVIPVAAAGVSAARTVVGPRLPIDARQMRLSLAEIYADPGKSHNELGVPFTPFRTALRSGYEWYRDNGYLDG